MPERFHDLVKFEHSGDSCIIDPTGEVIAGPAEGETILTEYSHKYTLEGFADMAQQAGFAVRKAWTDADRLFSVQYCVRA